MHIDLLIDNFRNMNHLIELDDEENVYQGWIRFYDPGKNMKIPDSQEDKFIKAQLIKSNMFEKSVNVKKSYL